jgi:hypothetical protein
MDRKPLEFSEQFTVQIEGHPRRNRPPGIIRQRQLEATGR